MVCVKTCFGQRVREASQRGLIPRMRRQYDYVGFHRPRALLIGMRDFLATRNPQTIAELCHPPTSAGEWAHWTLWLIIAILE